MGVIASLTIPSLIQNTHKKEEVVKIKKGLSVINQALAMEKALTGNDLSAYGYHIEEMFKKRLSINKTFSSYSAFVLQDGLTFYPWTWATFDEHNEISKDNYYIEMYIYTKPVNNQADLSKLESAAMMEEDGSLNNLTGLYKILCGYDRCVPSANTAAIINASDPTKAE